jgi:hypothetical protein
MKSGAEVCLEMGMRNSYDSSINCYQGTLAGPRPGRQRMAPPFEALVKALRSELVSTNDRNRLLLFAQCWLWRCTKPWLARSNPSTYGGTSYRASVRLEVPVFSSLSRRGDEEEREVSSISSTARKFL